MKRTLLWIAVAAIAGFNCFQIVGAVHARSRVSLRDLHGWNPSPVNVNHSTEFGRWLELDSEQQSICDRYFRELDARSRRFDEVRKDSYRQYYRKALAPAPDQAELRRLKDQVTAEYARV